MSDKDLIPIVFCFRFVAFTAICYSIEATITQHIPYGSWQEMVLLGMAAAAWTCGDYALKAQSSAT